MTKLKAIIFDVDGTLANTERDGHRVAFNRTFAEAGLNWHWSVDFYGKLLEIAGGKERIKFYLQQYQPDFLATDNLSNFIANLHQTKTKHYQQLLAEGSIPLRPGVKRIIQAARQQGIRLAIATTSALPNAIALLEQTLSPSWFEVIAAGDIVKAKKPASDIYHYVLQQMNLAPNNCLVFEDSAHGLQAAKGANLSTIVTVNNYTQGQNFTNAKLVLDHLGEPDHPCRVIQGNLLGSNYLDLSILPNYLSELDKDNKID